MAFFEWLARTFLSFLSTIWGYMKTIAGAIINNTFGAFTGQPFSEEVAAYIVFGVTGFIVVVIFVMRKMWNRV